VNLDLAGGFLARDGLRKDLWNKNEATTAPHKNEHASISFFATKKRLSFPQFPHIATIRNSTPKLQTPTGYHSSLSNLTLSPSPCNIPTNLHIVNPFIPHRRPRLRSESSPFDLTLPTMSIQLPRKFLIKITDWKHPLVFTAFLHQRPILRRSNLTQRARFHGFSLDASSWPCCLFRHRDVRFRWWLHHWRFSDDRRHSTGWCCSRMFARRRPRIRS
jgi:hypothetical protein